MVSSRKRPAASTWEKMGRRAVGGRGGGCALPADVGARPSGEKGTSPVTARWQVLRAEWALHVPRCEVDDSG